MMEKDIYFENDLNSIPSVELDRLYKAQIRVNSEILYNEIIFDCYSNKKIEKLFFEGVSSITVCSEKSRIEFPKGLLLKYLPIHIFFKNSTDIRQVLEDIYNWCERNNENFENWNGSLVNYNNLFNEDLNQLLPIGVRYHCFSAEKSLEFSNSNLYNEIFQLVRKIDSRLSKIKSTDELNRFKVELNIGRDIIKNIVGIRSLRLIWIELLQKHFAISKDYPLWITAKINASNFMEKNLIETTYMMSSSFLAMVDEISSFVQKPSRANLEFLNFLRPQFSIIKFESGLDNNVDSLKGSYAVDTLTYELTKHIFNQLKSSK